MLAGRLPIVTIQRSIFMGKGLLLWLIGVPIPVILVLWLLFFR